MYRLLLYCYHNRFFFNNFKMKEEFYTIADKNLNYVFDLMISKFFKQKKDSYYITFLTIIKKN